MRRRPGIPALQARLSRLPVELPQQALPRQVSALHASGDPAWTRHVGMSGGQVALPRPSAAASTAHTGHCSTCARCSDLEARVPVEAELHWRMHEQVSERCAGMRAAWSKTQRAGPYGRTRAMLQCSRGTCILARCACCPASTTAPHCRPCPSWRL